MSAEVDGQIEDVFESDLSDVSIPGFDDAPAAEGAESQEAAVAGDESQEAAPTTEEQAEGTPAADAKAAEAAAQAATAKQFAFKQGEQEIKLDETALLPVKADGKVQEVPLKELVNNYAGKVAWDKRMNDAAMLRKQVTQERTGFEAEREKHKSLITNLHSKMKEGKTLEAVSSLVQMTGLKIDPREYVKSLRESWIAQAQQLAQLSPEDRARFEFEEDREYFKAQQQSWQQQREAEQAAKAFEQRVANVIQQSGMTHEEFEETQQFLAERTRAEGGDPKLITPEKVAEHKKMVRAYTTARDAIAAVDPDAVENGLVKDDDRWNKLAALVTAHPEFSAEEFAEMYREARKSKQAAAVSKKVTKAPTPTAATAALRAKPKQQADVDVTKAPFTAADFEW